MRPLEYGSCADSEIQLASIAAIETALTGRDALFALADAALGSVRPKPRFKVNPCGLLVWEHPEKLEGAYRALAHGLIVVNSLEGVKYYFYLLSPMLQPTSRYDEGMDERLKTLKTDAKGNIVSNPVTGWTTVLAANSALLVAFQYIDREEQFESGERNSVQLVMTPEQCLELAGELTDVATRLLRPSPPGTPIQ